MSRLTYCGICRLHFGGTGMLQVKMDLVSRLYDNETVICDHCGERCIEQNTVSDENTISVQIVMIIVPPLFKLRNSRAFRRYLLARR